MQFQAFLHIGCIFDAHLIFNRFKITAWNVQSANVKLSEKNVKKMLHNYGFIFLFEIKKSLKISCTGCI